jgi:chromosome partitioning protein
VIYTVTNQKGGTGKTTTAAALWAGLTKRGLKALAIDLDPQRNLTYISGATADGLTVLDVIKGTAAAAEAIQTTAQGDIIAASEWLAGADMVIRSTVKLREALETVIDRYDHIVIDTAPALGVLTVNALTACNTVIVPAQADILSIQGVSALYDIIKDIQHHSNPQLTTSGILLTRQNSRTTITKQLTESLNAAAGKMGTRLFSAKIRECTTTKEAQALQQSVFDYAPRSNVATDYGAFIDELITQTPSA